MCSNTGAKVTLVSSSAWSSSLLYIQCRGRAAASPTAEARMAAAALARAGGSCWSRARKVASSDPASGGVVEVMAARRT